MKTSDTERYQGFESLPLRFLNILFITLVLEDYSRGRRGSPAKGVGRVTDARVQIPCPPLKPHEHWIFRVHAVFLLI